MGEGKSIARKPAIEQIKMLCLSNKKGITEIKSSCRNFLKMIITWAILLPLYGNVQLLQHLFVFVHQKNNFLVI